jgi:hypothetical protein
MRNAAFLIVGGLVAGSYAVAQPAPAPDVIPTANCAPAMLTRMTVRNISPGVPAAAPAAQPRQIWRKGSMQLRTEESPDPMRGVHSVIIVDEPNIWMVNMATRSGQRQTDPGPTYEVRAPILPLQPGMPAPLAQLEYGCEGAFVAAHAKGAPRPVPWGADTANLHTAEFGEHQVSVMMHVRRNAPLMVVYARANQPVFAIRYDDYRSDLPDRPELFQPPKSAQITEAPPAGGTPPPPQRPGDRL